jgi:hypothetical protein
MAAALMRAQRSAVEVGRVLDHGDDSDREDEDRTDPDADRRPLDTVEQMPALLPDRLHDLRQWRRGGTGTMQLTQPRAGASK